MIKIHDNVATITVDPMKIDIITAGEVIEDSINDYLSNALGYSVEFLNDNDYGVIMMAILQNIEERLPKGE